MVFRRRNRSRRSGCALLLVACSVACALLIVNRLIVSSLYSALMPSELDHPKLRTLVAMLALVGLLIPEWWLIDVVSAKLTWAVHALRASRSDAPH